MYCCNQTSKLSPFKCQPENTQADNTLKVYTGTAHDSIL